MISENSISDKSERLRHIFESQVPDVYKTVECKDLMNFLRKFSSSVRDSENCIDLTDFTDNDNCMKFFRDYLDMAIENCSEMLQKIVHRQYINLIKLTVALWNMSDGNQTLCSRMGKFEIHVYLIRLLGKMRLSSSLLNNQQIQLFAMSIVGILYNINRKVQHTRSRYRKENIVKFLMPLATQITSKSLLNLKTTSLLLLGFLVNENESNNLNVMDCHIIYMIEVLRDTINPPERFSNVYGYHCLEILEGLRNIASQCSNKISLLKNGILSVIEILLQIDNETKYPKETLATLELLWSLSFSKECLAELEKSKSALKKRLDELVFCSNQEIVRSVRGILWNLENSKQPLRSSDIIHKPNVNGHIMISYHQSTLEVMVKIKNKLKENGYQVWMDVEWKDESYSDTMINGVELASSVLIGMCQEFKNSPRCRQEVKHAFDLNITIVPTMLEAEFIPDGWLGLICATIIHTEFTDSRNFDRNMMELQRQLGGFTNTSTGKPSRQTNHNGLPADVSVDKPINITSPHTQQNYLDAPIKDVLDSNDLIISPTISSDEEHLSSLCSLLSDNELIKISITSSSSDNYMDMPISTWSKAECSDWLSNIDIPVQQHGFPLTDIDGPLLLTLAEMRLTAPEMFFKTAKEDMKLDFLQTLRLSHALKAFKNVF